MNFLKRTDQNRMFKVTAKHGQTAEDVQLSYTREKVVGNGSFGVVYQAKIQQTGELVAIKKVLQDRRYENRELQIIRSVYHPNIVAIKAFFYTQGDQKKDEIYLNLVLEYMPETLYRTIRRYVKSKQVVPPLYVKLFIYQLLRSLAYIHTLGICHRDIKPQNLLLDPATGILKLCDFGSAKALVAGKPNVSYICSRYYRAPELLFGATNYTTAIDIWSSGCVMAESMLGQPLFQGDRNIEQLVEIIKVRGTPTREQLLSMNPNYMESRLPQIKPRSLAKVFPSRTSPASIDLIGQLLEYVPEKRPNAIELLAHPYFDELRDPNTKMMDGRDLPELFDFTYQELSVRPDLLSKIVPLQYEKELLLRGIDIYSLKSL